MKFAIVDGGKTEAIKGASPSVQLIQRNFTALPHVAIRNGFDRVAAGLRTAIGGKRVREGGFSGQCAVIRRRFRATRNMTV